MTISRYFQQITQGPNGRISWHNAGEPESPEVQDLGLVDGYRYVLHNEAVPEQPDDVMLEELADPPVERLREVSPVLKRQDEGMVKVREQITGTFGVTLGDFIVIRHKQFGSQWGWRAEMNVESESFNPGVRAVAIYSDSAHTQYLYTTGAFTWDATAERWATEWNPGHGSKQDIHWAVLYASLQEQKGTLAADADADALFLRYGLPQVPVEPPPDADWVDTGATVTGQAGQLYYVSVPIDALGLVPGQAIKLGDAETTYTSTWGGTDNLMQITPYVAAATGAKVWK